MSNSGLFEKNLGKISDATASQFGSQSDLVHFLEEVANCGNIHRAADGSNISSLSICAGSLLRLQDMPDPKVWTAAVIKGGRLGIFGDFIFNEYDRYGRTFMAEAQGPVISDINSIASIIAKAKEGKMTKAREEALKLRTNNIPGRNLFYLLPAITLLEK